VGCLIVHPPCKVTLPVEPFFEPHQKEFMRSSRPTARIESGLYRKRPHRERQGEKVRARDGRRGARLSRDPGVAGRGPIRLVGQLALSN